MNFSQDDFNSLIEIVKSFPEVRFVGQCTEGQLGPCIATGEPWPEALIKEVEGRFPNVYSNIQWINVKVRPLIGN